VEWINWLTTGKNDRIFFEDGNKHLGSMKCQEGVNNAKLIYLRCFYIHMEHV